MYRRFAALLVGAFLLASCGQDNVPQRLSTEPELPGGHMYLMRGLFGGDGMEYSRGVDTIAAKSKKEYGLDVTVKSWRTSDYLCQVAIANYRKDGKPIYLLGHSLGANEVSDIAHCLAKYGIPVAFAFYYDPTPFVACVPDNVKFATSWRRSFPFDLGGGTISRCNPRTKNIANITVQTRHTVLDDLPLVHDGTLKRVGISQKLEARK
jgi:hypothetical protein